MTVGIKIHDLLLTARGAIAALPESFEAKHLQEAITIARWCVQKALCIAVVPVGGAYQDPAEEKNTVAPVTLGHCVRIEGDLAEVAKSLEQGALNNAEARGHLSLLSADLLSLAAGGEPKPLCFGHDSVGPATVVGRGDVWVTIQEVVRDELRRERECRSKSGGDA